MITLGNYKEEQEKNISRPYTMKQWEKLWLESLGYIDSKLENSSMVEQLPDTKKAESSTLSFPTI